MKNVKKWLVPIIFFVALSHFTGCALSSLGGNSGDDDDNYSSSSESSSSTHQYLIIPNSSWHSGSPSYSTSQGGMAPTVTVKNGSPTLTVGGTVTWEITLESFFELYADVSVVIITSDSLDGYFTYPISEEDIQNGYVDIEMWLEEDIPSEAICNRDYNGNGTCYEQADNGITTSDFSVANDAGGDIISLTVEAEVSLTIIEVSVEDEESDDYDSDDYSSNANCYNAGSYCGCSTFEACTNGSSSWYNVGAGVYYCASTSDCYSAAQNAVNYCTQGCY